MKKVNWLSILSSILILTLAIGLSYLGLNQVSTEDEEANDMKMSIAIVNEDDGAHFQGSDLAFGEEFIKSISRDSAHDWYVVSRGVAENGYEQNDYNMMIVIPNDFSEKAISIDSHSPDPVVLNYKINASGHEGIRTEAEKTASQILNDFNRRIIDVYFASVIGNLQEAQDNIEAIIEKETVYTHTYNDSINLPLSNYTNQFDAIQDNTELSKESFASLEDILDSFESELNEGVDGNKNYYSNVTDLAKLKEKNSLFLLNFSDQLNQYREGLSSNDVNEQLALLGAANKAINDQFRSRTEQDDASFSNIVLDSNTIKNYFNETKVQVDDLIAYLEEDLLAELQSKVEEELEIAFRGGYEELNRFFNRLDRSIKRHHINNQIRKLPSLSIKDLEYLPEETYKDLKNVILVTEQYIKDEGYEYEHSSDNSKMLSTLIAEIKEQLQEGFRVSDEVIIEGGIEAESILDLKIPHEYEVSKVFLTYNNRTYEIDHIEDIYLPPLHDEKLVVELDLNLKEASTEEIDVFKPVAWGWKLHSESSDQEQEEENTGVDHSGIINTKQNKDMIIETLALSTSNEQEMQENPDIDQDENGLNDQDESVEEPESGEGEENGTEDPETDEPADPNEPNENESEDPEEEPEEEPEEPEEPEIITITNNYYYRSVMSPIEEELVEGDPTKTLIEVATNTVSEYERMLSLYEIYYGLDMKDENLPEKIRNLNDDESLVDLEREKEEQSLHYVFNETDIDKLLKDFFVEDVTEQIMRQIRTPIDELQADVEEYELLVNKVDANADKLVEHIQRTTDQANIMNTNLRETLDNIEIWRERSNELSNEQSEVLVNENEEQSFVMSLDSDFQPLLMQSESLANQAQNNLSSADTVYQTFDAIDNQAITIQQSGVNLVSEAEDLSVKLTNKLIEDQEFADNFTNVLSNSRVGDRQNENLFNFLSNPVKTENDGTIVAGDTFTPYFLVLILSIVALFTAYVISASDQKQTEEDLFDTEKTLIGKNMPLTLIITGIGLVEGVVIGVMSGYLLSIGQANIFMWTAIITLTMITMLTVATYLLRQLKTIGMFILLTVLSLYLFFTEALGFGFNTVSFVDKLRMFSPLQYVETLLTSTAHALASNQSLAIMFFSLIGILLVGFVANLLVFSKSQTEEEMDNEEMAEAN